MTTVAGQKRLDDHSAILRAAYKRVDELEPRLAGILQPILSQAGRTAASAFEATATNHLTAAARPAPGRFQTVIGSRALTAAATPDWSAPAADEIIDVPALVAQIREKTAPVREAFLATMMTPLLENAGVKFDVTNPLTAKVLSQSASQVTNIADTTRLNVMRIIKSSYEGGLSIPDTAKAIRVGMQDASKARSTLIARTELAGVANGGSLAATQIAGDALGATYFKQWLCVPPGTRVAATGVIAAVKKPYAGELVTITALAQQSRHAHWGDAEVAGNLFVAEPLLAANDPRIDLSRRDRTRTSSRPSGAVPALRTFTVTPDHLVLTRRGWIPAGSLQEGDEVVGRAAGNRDGQCPDIDDVQPMIEDVFDSAAQRLAAVGMVGRPVYLDCHDAVGEKVDVVTTAGNLGGNIDIAVSEPLREFMLSFSDVRFAHLLRSRTTNECGVGKDSASIRVGSRTSAGEKYGGVALMAKPVGFALGSKLDSAFNQDSSPETVGDPEGTGQFIEGFSSFVQFDEVVVVSRRPYSGHVYDLTTLSGWFFADDYVAHNTSEGATFPRHEDYEGLDGQTVGLEETFEVGDDQLAFPGDPDGSPEEVCLVIAGAHLLTRSPRPR